MREPTCKSTPGLARTVQCAACPWKTRTNPHTDIPGGYDPAKHERLLACDGRAGSPRMACHETPRGREQACVGWLAWAVGEGNSIPLRLAALSRRWKPGALVLDGPQHPSLAAMVATARRAPRSTRRIRSRPG